ncbi:hypothetical protein O1611_g7667 [Lasiodiplodia mahajangana]|uniref:Uncharacterized protein n=1 Tax=Lasiodiplodia mahajangana TaxID=1108764 RepID=A0ACC2JEW4_9PEZI|nr:hypothetical protein O1611_g7667 [Lasiodiplodia mahajangana]
MLRRSHKKTKKGSKCEECRRRHIRASSKTINVTGDKHRRSPCTGSDRVCTYGSIGQSLGQSPTTPPRGRPNATNNTPPPLSQPPAPPSPGSLGRLSGDSLVNITHLELLHHFTQGTFLFIDRDAAPTDRLKRIALSSAFSNLYLMHGILAFAARHMSTQVAPERSSHYLGQSTELQTWALANFNPAPPEPDQNACVALFLFSSLTCLQSLADMAAPGTDPEPFFIRFGQSFGLQRGVRTIISDHWSRFAGSEIQSLLEWCELASLRKGQGSECKAIRELVAQSTGLSPAATEACHVAIEQLQCIFDEYSVHRLMPTHGIYLTLAWPLLVPEKMTDLLVLRRPVALIILAYYGVTLGLIRHLWMVGQTGKHIVHAIDTYLGLSWASWLRWPREAVGIEAL